jgi:hypothetical protein
MLSGCGVCIYLHLYLLSFFLVLITRPLAVHQTIQYIKEKSIFLSALLLLQGFIVSPLPLPTDSLLRQGFIFYDTAPPYFFRVSQPPLCEFIEKYPVHLPIPISMFSFIPAPFF